MIAQALFISMSVYVGTFFMTLIEEIKLPKVLLVMKLTVQKIGFFRKFGIKEEIF